MGSCSSKIQEIDKDSKNIRSDEKKITIFSQAIPANCSIPYLHSPKPTNNEKHDNSPISKNANVSEKSQKSPFYLYVFTPPESPATHSYAVVSFPSNQVASDTSNPNFNPNLNLNSNSKPTTPNSLPDNDLKIESLPPSPPSPQSSPPPPPPYLHDNTIIISSSILSSFELNSSIKSPVNPSTLTSQNHPTFQPPIVELQSISLIEKKDTPLHSNIPLTIPSTISSTSSLENLVKKCADFSLSGEKCIGYCVKAYDGDTCTVNIQTKIGDHQWKVRLLGFDAPEIKTKNIEEKIHALACRDTLLELIGEKFCVVECHQFEKYGRLLGTLYIRQLLENTYTVSTQSCEKEDLNTKNQLLLNVNQWMLQHTPCVAYDGGTKEKITYDLTLYHPVYLKHYHHHNNHLQPQSTNHKH